VPAWQDITAPMLEIVRKRLRNLIKLIEKTKRKIVYTDFVDEIGAPTGIKKNPRREPSSTLDFSCTASANAP
jgi:type I site-specific restriction endonuclease